MYFYRDPTAKPNRHERENVGIVIELKLVNASATESQRGGHKGIGRDSHHARVVALVATRRAGEAAVLRPVGSRRDDCF
jgi:hypothetical protein